MKKIYFSLSPVENSKTVRIIQAAFGIVCFGLAIFWFIFNINSLKTVNSSWVTIVFLVGFAFYMVWAGIGKASRFVELENDKIRVKKTILFPPIDLSVNEIRKIEFFPFKIVFILKTEKKSTLSLSSAYHETNANIKEAVFIFAEEHSIELEEIEEKI